MAIAVIVGLIFATALTLILVPVLYYMFENGRRNVNRFFFDTANPNLLTDTEFGNGQKRQEEQEKTEALEAG
ncbi:MAG: hypothetical protein U5K69_27585 [Balneolaceae bacterium]|nr:hypothetical protein [Balneolaceae bacterium]